MSKKWIEVAKNGDTFYLNLDKVNRIEVDKVGKFYYVTAIVGKYVYSLSLGRENLGDAMHEMRVIIEEINK